jgi:hypothetical protein
MTDAPDPRTRTAAGTKMEQVYRAIRAGHATVAAIAQATGLPLTAVYTACKWLRLGGYVCRSDGQRRHARWIRVLGRVYRGDQRGKPEGCRNRARNLGPSVLAMNRAKFGPKWCPRPRDSHPLARAWTVSRSDQPGPLK